METVETENSEAISYDLKMQDRIIRGRLPTLEIIHDRLVRMFRITMSGALRRVVDVSVRSTDLIKFGELVKTIPVPASITLYGMKPLSGACLLILETELVFALLDAFYGSPDGLELQEEATGRDFTLIEQELIRRVVISFLADLEIAWKPVFPIQMAYHRMEINPQFAAVVPQSEVVIIVALDVQLPGKKPLRMTICMPWPTVEPLRKLLDSGFFADREEKKTSWESRLIRNFNDAKLSLVAKTRGKSLSVNSFINLKEGDFLLSDNKSNQPIDVYINGRRKMTGVLQENKGRQTVEVAEIFEAHINDEVEKLRKQALKLKGEI